MGPAWTWYLFYSLYQALVSVRSIEECREFLLYVLRKFQSTSNPTSFPKQVPSPGPKYSGDVLLPSPCFLTAALPHPLRLVLQRGLLSQSRLILGTWSLSSGSPLGRQVNLADSYSHYLFSLSYHLLF